MRSLALSFFVLASPPAFGQSFLYRYTDTSTPGTGWAVRGVGDVDGDQRAEIAIASYRYDCGFAGCGAGPSKVALLSGATQNVLWEYTPPTFDGSGIALSPISDIDGDGVRDLLIGANDVGFPFSIGEARLLSGASGALIQSYPSPGTPNDGFGASVAGLGDLDGDVVADFVAASWFEAFVIASGTGNVLFSTGAIVPFPAFTVVARYGDFDADGVSDVLVGQPSYDGVTSGAVRIYSGANGAVLRTFQPATFTPTFGYALAPTSDFDGDGRPDVVVGTPELDYGNGSGPGRVEVIGSSTGAVVRTFAGAQAGEHLGLAVASGDFDGDGVLDIAAASACEFNAANCTRHAFVWSGANSQLLLSTSSAATGEVGVALDFVGDFDGNTVSELAFGSACSNAFSDCGEARFYADAAGAVYSYCTAGTSTNGCTPAMGAIGVPSASASSGFTLRATGVEGQRQGIFFYGVSGPQSVPWGTGSSSTLCVKSPHQRMSLLASGGTALQCDGAFTQDWNAYMAANANALGNPRMVGEAFDAQAWYRDPPAPKQTNLSNALHFTLEP